MRNKMFARRAMRDINFYIPNKVITKFDIDYYNNNNARNQRVGHTFIFLTSRDHSRVRTTRVLRCVIVSRVERLRDGSDQLGLYKRATSVSKISSVLSNLFVFFLFSFFFPFPSYSIQLYFVFSIASLFYLQLYVSSRILYGCQ